MGGTAYFIVEKDSTGSPANLLIDAPADDPALLQFIADRGGVRYWAITHRGASGAAKSLDRKSTRLNSSHSQQSRMPSSA